MTRTERRSTRTILVSFASLLAGACFVACTGTTGETAATTEQAATVGAGVLHSHVTRDSWQRRVGRNGGGWDDARICHPAPLAICPLFDSEFGIGDGGTACARQTTPSCPDRVDTWDDAIVFDFAVAVTGDCRFGEWAPPLLTDDDVTNYLNDLLAFTLQFFGCPEAGTTTPLTFGLIPTALQSHKFTTADLEALSDAYSAAVAQALSDSGLPTLTSQQALDVDRKLRRLARHVPDVVRSPKFNFSTCDAGGAPASVDTTPDDEADCR